MKLGDAVGMKMIANETLGYFIARTFLFLVRAGCKPAHIRFRQHLPDEMAHYAADCWDAEIEMSLGWVECVGIADRSAYDLTCHGKATNTSLTASVDLETPVKSEKYVLTKKAEVGRRAEEPTRTGCGQHGTRGGRHARRTARAADGTRGGQRALLTA